jgi:hypothetical protein
MRKIILFLIFPIILGGCFTSDLEFEEEYLVVVEAYLYAGANLTDINLTSMISFGNDSTGGEGIEDATVTLSDGSDTWVLGDNPDSSGSYIPSETIPVESGDLFEIQVEVDDIILNAQTLVPGLPPDISMSSTSLSITKVDDIMEDGPIEFPDPLELSWENPDNHHYYFKIENIEDDPESIMPDPPDDMPFAKGGFVFQMVTRPVDGEAHEISMRDLTHFGTHRITVYSVNEEYVNLYETQEQDTRKLNEPYTNIENGLGIFTSFSSDTLYFEVIPVDGK